MSLRSDWKQLTFKDKMDILEAFFTIIVSIMALWGTFKAYEGGLFHKVSHIVEHYHEQIVREESKIKDIENRPS